MTTVALDPLNVECEQKCNDYRSTGPAERFQKRQARSDLPFS